MPKSKWWLKKDLIQEAGSFEKAIPVIQYFKGDEEDEPCISINRGYFNVHNGQFGPIREQPVITLDHVRKDPQLAQLLHEFIRQCDALLERPS